MSDEGQHKSSAEALEATDQQRIPSAKVYQDPNGRSRVERRGRDRKPLHTSCRVWFLVEKNTKSSSLPAMTRNISNRGVGIAIRRSFHANEPIELRIELPERPLHAAGLVRFCRYLSGGLFEVGVELMSAGSTPIFADDPTRAVRRLRWLAEALRQ